MRLSLVEASVRAKIYPVKKFWPFAKIAPTLLAYPHVCQLRQIPHLLNPQASECCTKSFGSKENSIKWEGFTRRYNKKNRAQKHEKLSFYPNASQEKWKGGYEVRVPIYVSFYVISPRYGTSISYSLRGGFRLIQIQMHKS